MVDHPAHNRAVAGSIPAGPKTKGEKMRTIIYNCDACGKKVQCGGDLVELVLTDARMIDYIYAKRNSKGEWMSDVDIESQLYKWNIGELCEDCSKVIVDSVANAIAKIKKNEKSNKS